MIHSALMVSGLSMLLSTATEATDPSLVGWWKLDESSGTVAHDSSGHHHHGTLHGDPQWVSGVMAGAIQLDGSGDYVDIGSVGITWAAPRTVTGWAKASTTTIPGWTTVFGFAGEANYNTPRWDIEVDPGGNYAFHMGPSLSWPLIPVDTQWHHFAITSDGDNGYSYVDGDSLGGGPGLRNIRTVDEVRIGIRLSNGHCFSGIVDDVRIYDDALTPDEIKEITVIVGPEASDPRPEDGAQLSDTWVKLQWSPGNTSASHDVYLGDHFTDVNEGISNTYRGNQTDTFYCAGFTGFAYPEGLVLGTTYYWRIDEVEADGVTTHKGAVWSFSVLPKIAHKPYPADGAERVETTTTLSWKAGLGAVQHRVYFGENLDEVNIGAGGPPQTTTTYTPNLLEPGKVYYWRVDEFDGLTTHQGDIWTFTTGDFLVVEDFEDYTDNEANNETIWQTWIDGFGTPDNGSQAGHATAPYAEQTIVRGGSHSMPLFYVNTAGVTNSQVERILSNPRDWTVDNVEELVIWFHGRPATVGSFTEGPDGTYTMTGSGAQIFAEDEEFHYAYKTLNGAGSILARVDSVQNTNPWAKAGVMIRETLNVGAKFAYVVIAPGNYVNSLYRRETDGGMSGTTQSGITAPHWVRLERDVAGNFTMSHSADGSAWAPVLDATSQNIQMSSKVYIGLVVTASNAALTCEAIFSNVTITGTVSPQWGHQDIGIASNAVEPLYVALSNRVGTPAVVYHDDPTAITIDTWTEWVIPLRKFTDQDLDLTDIDRIAIGLGAKGSLGETGSGGAGVIYIDDIRLYRPVPK